MLLSQKLIHTRVYGQGIVVLSTVCIMAYVKHMEMQGGIYRMDEEGKIVRGYNYSGLRHWYSTVAGQTLDEKMAQNEIESAKRVEQEQGSGTFMIVPLVWIPLISGIHLGLRGRVSETRVTQATLAAIGGALGHAGYVQFSDSSMGFDRK